jgi:DNA mismatch repair protein MutL
MIIAKENKDMFARAGFSFEEFGENTIKLMSVPSMCEELNTKQLFLDILDEIDTVAVTARQEKEDKFIATVACKAAVKAKMKLDEQEVKSLMEQLLSLPNPFTCPHGRPTAIKMTKYDLERKFSRR